jgi:hypothetical protein
MVEHTLFMRIGTIYLRLVADSAGKESGIRFLKVPLTMFSVLMLYSIYTHTQGVWIRRERSVGWSINELAGFRVQSSGVSQETH